MGILLPSIRGQGVSPVTDSKDNFSLLPYSTGERRTCQARRDEAVIGAYGGRGTQGNR